MVARGRKKSAASRTSAANTIRANNSGSRGPELRPLLSQRRCEFSNLETNREKELESVRPAEEIHGLRQRAELLPLASVHMSLPVTVVRRQDHGPGHLAHHYQ